MAKALMKYASNTTNAPTAADTSNVNKAPTREARHVCSSCSAYFRCWKFLLLALLFVFLTFPYECYAVRFGYGNDDDAHKGVLTTVGRQAGLKSRQTVTKFKFHKVNRLSTEANNDDNDFEDDNDDDNDNDDDDDYENVVVNDKDNDSVEIKRILGKKAAKNRDNKDERIRFESVRHVRRDESTPIIKMKYKKNNKHNNENSDEESSFYASVFSGFFGGHNKHAKNTDDRDPRIESSQETAEKSNGIIGWIKWFGDRTKKDKDKGTMSKAAVTENETLMENLISYLNRWPFNTIFPMGQPTKPVKRPRRHRTVTKNDNEEKLKERVRPLTPERFDFLLHTLPGFVVNASGVEEMECRQQMHIFHRQLRGNKLWTLQMLDATGKIPSGLLRGNINQFGDFDLCMQARTLVKVTSDKSVRIRGKYCLAHIETSTSVPALKLPVHLMHGRGLWNSHLGNPSHFVPRYTVANWGICVPHSCSADVVQAMIEANLQPYNNSGVDFHVEVDEERDCYTRSSKSWLKLLQNGGKLKMSVFGFLVLLLLMLTTSLHDFWSSIAAKFSSWRGPAKQQQEYDTTTNAAEKADELNDQATTENATPATPATPVPPITWKQFTLQLFNAFSPRRTLNVLLAPNVVDTEFPIVHVLKLFITVMLYISLKYLMLGHLPLANRDRLVRVVDQPLSVLIRTPIIYMDMLLLLSGFQAACQLSDEMVERTHIQLLKRLIAKATRFLPLMNAMLVFQTWILPHLGSGPLWTNLIGQHAQLCEQQMWRNVFSIQNAIDFEETCSPMTIQLALEVQLYLLGPLLVWLAYVNKDAGLFIFSGLQALSVAIRFSRTQRDHLSMTLFHGINVSKFYRSANLLYASPIVRATPYLLGIGAGLLQRTQGGSFDIGAGLVPIGWVTCLVALVWCFCSPADGMRSDFVYSASEAAKYAAWCPLIMGIALCWIILMFPNNEEKSMLRFLASSRPVLLLSRISLPLQLVMYVVVLHGTAVVKEAVKFNLTDLMSLNEIGLILLIAIVLAFLIDVPAQQVRRLLVNRIFAEQSPNESELEPCSEADAADNRNESPNTDTSDTPEPTDSIWSSDPEEEELKYIARRRSSAPKPNMQQLTTVKPDEKETEEKEEENENENEKEKEKDEADEDEEEEEEEDETKPIEKEHENKKKKEEEPAVEEEETEGEEEEEESEISEEAEVKKRPLTPTTLTPQLPIRRRQFTNAD